MRGFQRHGVAPDMGALGKAMGSGYPAAGLVMRSNLVADIGAKAQYLGTFGGNTLATAAALEVIERERLPPNPRGTGAFFAATWTNWRSDSKGFEMSGTQGSFWDRDCFGRKSRDTRCRSEVVDRERAPPVGD